MRLHQACHKFCHFCYILRDCLVVFVWAICKAVGAVVICIFETVANLLNNPLSVVIITYLWFTSIVFIFWAGTRSRRFWRKSPRSTFFIPWLIQNWLISLVLYPSTFLFVVRRLMGTSSLASSSKLEHHVTGGVYSRGDINLWLSRSSALNFFGTTVIFSWSRYVALAPWFLCCLWSNCTLLSITYPKYTVFEILCCNRIQMALFYHVHSYVPNKFENGLLFVNIFGM